MQWWERPRWISAWRSTLCFASKSFPQVRQQNLPDSCFPTSVWIRALRSKTDFVRFTSFLSLSHAWCWGDGIWIRLSAETTDVRQLQVMLCPWAGIVRSGNFVPLKHVWTFGRDFVEFLSVEWYSMPVLHLFLPYFLSTRQPSLPFIFRASGISQAQAIRIGYFQDQPIQQH